MNPVTNIILYTAVILYLFFKVIVIIHAIKNQAGILWPVLVLIPGVDVYYYARFVKAD